MRRMAPPFYRLSLRCVYTKFNVWSDRRTFARALGENSRDGPSLYFAQHCHSAHLACCGSTLILNRGLRGYRGLQLTNRPPHLSFFSASVSSVSSAVNSFLLGTEFYDCKSLV